MTDFKYFNKHRSLIKAPRSSPVLDAGECVRIPAPNHGYNFGITGISC